MNLYLIRHAEAAPVGVDGVSRDEDRPLTDVGREQCRAVAHALRLMGITLDGLLTSPLVRARQTTEEILRHSEFGSVEAKVSDELAPEGRKRKVLRDVLALGGRSVALVGHNPDLSVLAGWFIDQKRGIELEKAAVASVVFEGPPDKGTGTLHWLVTPAWCALAAGSSS